MKIDISRRELEGALLIHIGASKPDTVVRHIRMMQTCGYIRLAKEGGVATNARYDLVGKKLREIRIGHGLETAKPAKKRAKR